MTYKYCPYPLRVVEKITLIIRIQYTVYTNPIRTQYAQEGCGNENAGSNL